jgi:hypothetical protein
MSSTTFPGPTPSQNNPPINPQYYQPRQYFISAITKGITTTITTTDDNDYVIGQLVRVLIPFGYGMYQINGQQAYVLSIPSANQVIINIDSRNYDSFISSFAYNLTLPQIIAIGDIGNGVINSNGRVLNGTFIPGSFINISPI